MSEINMHDQLFYLGSRTRTGLRALSKIFPPEAVSKVESTITVVG
jgi:hypothetical protein